MIGMVNDSDVVHATVHDMLEMERARHPKLLMMQ